MMMCNFLTSQNCNKLVLALAIVVMWWPSLLNAQTSTCRLPYDNDFCRPDAVPVPGLPDAIMSDITSQRGTIRQERTALRRDLCSQQSRCNQVEAGSELANRCFSESQAIGPRYQSYTGTCIEFNTWVESLVRHEPSGRGVVGGTGWQVAYNVQDGASPEVRARAREMVEEQYRAYCAALLVGGDKCTPWDERVDFDRYNFVVGIAESTNRFYDLATRVFPRDQFSEGGFSRDEQEAYNLLRNRHFTELTCHSNGAMVCLAALMNSEVRADRVVLNGPQITAQSLAMWNELLQANNENRIESLEIVINEGDPVPPASLLFSVRSGLFEGIVDALSRPVLARQMMFNAETLRSEVESLAPDAQVQTNPCESLVVLAAEMNAFQCHASGSYGMN